MVKSYTADSQKSISFLKAISNARLASTSNGNINSIWNTNTWSLIRTINPSNINGAIEQINNTLVATGGSDKIITIWDMNTGLIFKQILVPDNINSLKVVNNFLLCGTNNGHIGVYNIFNASQITYFTANSGGSGTNALEILCDQIIASGGSSLFSVKIWNFTKLISTNPIPTYTLNGHSDKIYALKRLSTTLLASSSLDFKINIWNWNTGILVKTLIGHANGIYRSLDIFSSDVLVSGSHDSTVKFWKISTGALLNTLLIPNCQINALVVLNYDSKF